MTEQSLNFSSIKQQLDKLELDIHHLRQLIQLPAEQSQSPYTTHPSIVTNPNILSGEPIIEGTRTPVRAIVEYWKFGASPEEISRRLPHLRLGQIFDALSFYDNNRQTIEDYIVLNQVPVD